MCWRRTAVFAGVLCVGQLATRDAGSAEPVEPDAIGREVAVAPKLCLDGYCPVTLANEKRWAKGDERFAAIHQGRTFLFKGPEQQQSFLADPDRYSPAFGGYDPIIWLEKKRLVDGRRRHGLWYRKTAWLFSSEDTLETFVMAPDVFSEISLPEGFQQQPDADSESTASPIDNVPSPSDLAPPPIESGPPSSEAKPTKSTRTRHSLRQHHRRSKCFRRLFRK